VSSPRRFGLPTAVRMRHDEHFVDRLNRSAGIPIGRLIPLEDIHPNPDQPRHDIGDLSELIASVREKGVLEPILVRPRGSAYQIIAGERRYLAAQEVGLADIPCIVRESSDAESLEIALIENLQRKDLHAFEEAEGLRVLADTYGYTHEDLAEKLGRSRSSVTETLSLTQMPDEVRELCRLSDIRTKSLLLQIVRQSSTQQMVALIHQLQEQGTPTSQQARRIRQDLRPVEANARPRHFVFRYQPEEKNFRLTLQFRKTQVPREELIDALQRIIVELRES
jgi:ParB family transcriptional regulator, chromosome partitioning protein